MAPICEEAEEATAKPGRAGCAGLRTVKKLANGTRASFTYDAANNLTVLANLKSDGTAISSDVGQAVPDKTW